VLWQAALPLSESDQRQLEGVLAAAEAECPVYTVPVCMADSVFRWLSTPFPSLKKARRVFPSLLNTQLPFDLAQCQYALLSIHTREGQARALAVAVRHETLGRILEQNEKLGIHPQVLQHEGIALWQEAEALHPPEATESRLLICLLRHRTLLLYGDAERLYGVQQLAAGADGLSNADDPERRAWAAKVRLFLNAHAENAEKALTCLWCGPGAAQTELRRALEEVLPLPDNAHFREADRMFREAPVAQAVNHMLNSRSDTVHNFRTGPFAHPQELTNRQRARKSALLWFYLLGVFLCLAALLWQIMLHRQNKVLDRQLEQAIQEITGSKQAPKAQEVPYVTRILEERRTTLRAFTDMRERPVEVLLRRLLNTAAEQRITLQRISLNAESAEIKGFADHWNAATPLEQLLQQRNDQTDLQRSEAGADERVHFTLKGIHREKN